MDMTRGLFLRMPTGKAPVDENSDWLFLVQLAWRIWYIESYKPENNQRPDGSDLEFMRTVNEWIKDYESG